MKPILLLLESNTSGTGGQFVEAAQTLGFQAMLLTADPARYSFVQENGVQTLQVNTSSVPDLFHAVEEISRGHAIIGVTTSSEYYLVTAALLARALGLPAANPDHLSICRNKTLQRKRLSSAGLLVPTYLGAQSAEDLEVAVTAIPPPLVVKPASGTGSIGVRLCTTPSEALDHGRELLAQRVNERGVSISPEVILESYIEGPEYSAELFSAELVGITRKHLSAEPYFVEIGHDYPASLDEKSLTAITETCKTALAALGLGWGPAHIEFRMTPSGPIVVEVNPRLAGGFIPSLVKLSTGIDLILQTVSVCCGQTADLSRGCDRAASIRFILYPSSGMFLGIEASALKTSPYVSDFRCYRSNPMHISIHHDFRDRAGHVIAVADSSSTASARVDDALSKIAVQMDSSTLPKLP